MHIFDSVHGLISFEREDNDDCLQGILDTAAMQRLRRIRQLGFSDLVYPGATHTRYAHSVGVFHNARRLLKVIRRARGDDYNNESARVAQFAALFHDVGHGPFSHSFEAALKRLKTSDGVGSAGKTLCENDYTHEAWSASILRDDDPAWQKALAPVKAAWKIPDLEEQAAALLKETAAGKHDKHGIYGEVVSSQFDADRLDYLERDRRATGVDIGHFDLEWLLHCLKIRPKGEGTGECWVVSDRGRQAVESFLLARVQLHGVIYQHPTTCGFERLFVDFTVCLAQAIALNKEPAVCAGNPLTEFLRMLVDGEPVAVKDWLALDDAAVWTLFVQVAGGNNNSDNKRLASLARRFVERDSLYHVDLRPLEEGLSRDDCKQGLANFRKYLLAQFPTLEDRQLDASPIIAAYHSDSEHSPILLEDGDSSPPRPIDDISPLVRSLSGRYVFRVYFEDEKTRDDLRDELHTAARAWRTPWRKNNKTT